MRSRSVVVYNQSSNCTLTAFSGDDFAYSTTASTFKLGAEETWLFVHRYADQGTNVTRWYAKKLAEKQQISTLTADVAQPSALGSMMWQTANTVATTLEHLADCKYGEEKFVYFNDANTTVEFSGAHFQGNKGVDWSPAVGDYMRCISKDGYTLYCFIVDDT